MRSLLQSEFPVFVSTPLLFLLALTLLTGCDNYSFVSAGKKVYRVNSFTGSVAAVDGNHFVRVSNSKVSGPSQAPTKVKVDDLSLNGLSNSQLALQRRWRDGRMEYIATIYPLSETLKAAQKSLVATLSIEFDDGDGFQIALVPLTVSSMTQIVDDKGKALQLQAKGSRTMSRETYESIKAVSVQWSGFPST